jgi:hypothetical protein
VERRAIAVMHKHGLQRLELDSDLVPASPAHPATVDGDLTSIARA